ncbi:MAG: hypothetical protein HRF45_00745, partial [Fimbriimonadia bacterium]
MFIVLVDRRALSSDWAPTIPNIKALKNVPAGRKLELAGDYFPFGGQGTAVKCVDFAVAGSDYEDGRWLAVAFLFKAPNWPLPPGEEPYDFVDRLLPPPPPPVVQTLDFVLDRQGPDVVTAVEFDTYTPNDTPPRVWAQAQDLLNGDPPGSGLTEVRVTVKNPLDQIVSQWVVPIQPCTTDQLATWTEWQGAWPPEPLVPGQYEVTVTASDGAGFVRAFCYTGPNTNSASDTFVLIIPPTVRCEPPPSCSCNPLTVRFCVSDADADFTKTYSYTVWLDLNENCRFDPGETVIRSGTFGGLVPGQEVCIEFEYTFLGRTQVGVEVTDPDGLRGSACCIYDPDVTPPDLRNGSPEGDCVCSPVENLRFELKDNCPEVTWVLKLDGVEKCRNTEFLVPDEWTPITCPGPFDLAGGLHTVEVVATDKCGNSKTYTWTFDVDKTPPTFRNPSPTGDCVCSPVDKLEVETSDNCEGVGR